MLKKMFSESGDVSCMRVMAVMSLLIGGVIAISGLFLGRDLNQIAMLSGVFVSAAFGGKAVQKFGERSE